MNFPAASTTRYRNDDDLKRFNERPDILFFIIIALMWENLDSYENWKYHHRPDDGDRSVRARERVKKLIFVAF